MGWIGVDLDGTLAEYPPQNGDAIGDIVPAMAERIRQWTSNKHEVRIFTVRAATTSGIKQVKAWLKANNLPALAVVTNVKERGMIELWDDKAIRVVKNTGVPCLQCGDNSKLHSYHGTLTNC